MDAVIIGGSLCGLMYGIVLKDMGYRVEIFERSPEDLPAQAGAGLQVSEDVKTFMETYQCGLTPYFIPNPKALVVDGRGDLITTLEPGVRATSWDTLYHRLRARFDGLKSEYYSQQLEDQTGAGVYRYGHRVTNFGPAGCKMKVEYVTPDGGQQCLVDLVVAADGAGSTMREVLGNFSKPQYLGYVALRGTVSPGDLTTQMREGVDRHCQIHQSFFLSYTIPGANGSIEPTNRVRNWVWYCRYPADDAEFHKLLTDVEGKRHEFSLPRGAMDPRVWKQRRSSAELTLDRLCADHLEKTTTPFVQAISHLNSSRAVYHDGRAILVGDAFATLRPLSGQGTNQAAKGALALKRVLQGQCTWEEWEESCITTAEKAHEFGLARERQAQLSD